MQLKCQEYFQHVYILMEHCNNHPADRSIHKSPIINLMHTSLSRIHEQLFCCPAHFCLQFSLLHVQSLKTLRYLGPQISPQAVKSDCKLSKYSTRLQKYVSWKTPGAQALHFCLTVLNEVFFHELG